MKKPVRMTATESSLHITLCVCICADGGHLQPLVIMPMKEFPEELETLASQFCWSGQENGWITEAIFKDWVLKLFIPYVKEKRELLAKSKTTAANAPEAKVPEANTPALLILDGHSSRACPEAMEALDDANITVRTIPAHSTHVFQPLDRHFFGEFKRQMRRLKRDTYDTDLPIKRFELLSAALEALHISSFAQKVKMSWRISGVYPIDPEQILANPSLYTTESIPQKKTGNRSYINISNKVLTSPECISELKMLKKKKEEKAAKKPRAKPAKTEEEKKLQKVIKQMIPKKLVFAPDSEDEGVEGEEKTDAN
jgi:hypothetical protein